MPKMKGTNPVRIANPDDNVETRLILSVRGGTHYKRLACIQSLQAGCSQYDY